MKIYYFILTLFVCSISFAQSTISGSVKNLKNEPVAGANVRVVGEKSGTSTDFDGKFKYSYIVPVQINSMDKDQVAISPNPAQNSLTVESTGHISSLELLNTSGAVIPAVATGAKP